MILDDVRTMTVNVFEQNVLYAGNAWFVGGKKVVGVYLKTPWQIETKKIDNSQRVKE